MTEEDHNKNVLLTIANAIGKPEVDYTNLHYHFADNSVMITSEGNLVGIIHRGVYNSIMKQVLEAESD